MVSTAPTTVRLVGAAVRSFLVLTVLLGLIYPFAVLGVGQLAFNGNANGSMISLNGKEVGSDLIGQSFSDKDGNPLPQYFQPRPSAAGDGYDPTSTSASNLGPNSPELAKLIQERRAAVAEFDGVDAADVPPDAVTASGSGLDPHISPEYAAIQIARVATERGLSTAEVTKLVDDNTQGRILGFLGEPRVNVVMVNLALDELS